MSWQEEAALEMWEAAAASDRAHTPAAAYQVREKSQILQSGFPTLADAQQWRDRWERKNRPRGAIAERMPQ